MFNRYKNIGIFRLSPESEYSDYSNSHLKKGSEYQKRFDTLPGRRLLFALERQVVFDNIDNVKKHLDFACGTGRWLSLPGVEKSYGMDISSSMLQVAENTHKDSRLLRFDFREADKLEGCVFDLITAFRFFPNADLKLRKEAIRYITGKLSDNGTLILNNHRNFWSLSYVFFRFLFLGFWQAGMSHNQIVTLIEQSGLRLVKSYSLGVIPQGERRAILPWFIAERIEKINAKYFSRFHRLGYDVVYICKKQ